MAVGLPVLGQGDGAGQWGWGRGLGQLGEKGAARLAGGAVHVQCSQLLSPSLSPSQRPAPHEARSTSCGDTEWGSPASALS